MATSSDRTRLHIAPFNSTLYSTLIPPRLQTLATNLSYHTTQTDPDTGFGYVELPKLEADKLRNKLNGAVLKGHKMKVEVAKPEKRKRIAEENSATAKDDETPKKKKVKKSKRKDGEYKGFELPEGRQVKRGWTEDPKSSSRSAKDDESKKPKERRHKQEKSKFTAEKEVLFKTALPEKNAAIAVDSTKKKDKKDKKEKKTKEKKSGAKEKVVLHEFEKNVQFPSFLRAEKTGTGKVAMEYIEGKGWIDEDGNVVDAPQVEPKREDRLAKMPENRIKPVNAADSEDEPRVLPKKKERTKEVVWDDEDQANDSAVDEQKKEHLARIDRMLDEEGSESEEDIKDAVSESGDVVDSAELRGEEEDVNLEDEEDKDEDMVDAGASDSSSEEESQGVGMNRGPDDKTDAKTENTVRDKADDRSDKESEAENPDRSSSDSGSESEATASDATPRASVVPETAISTPLPADTPREVHPLEALYKRPKSNEAYKKPTPIKTAFSFSFGGGDDVSDDDVSTTREVPQTPFSAQELRGRRSRSAAPTPDTAAIGKRFSFAFAADDAAYDDAFDEEDEDMTVVNEPAYCSYDNDDWDAGVASKEAPEATKEGGETEFSKWFWENRGDSNRGWKKRRREALKVGRQRENRRVGRTVV